MVGTISFIKEVGSLNLGNYNCHMYENYENEHEKKILNIYSNMEHKNQDKPQ
jgi:hypothetical protein